jgi:hypothetical protein
LVNLLAFRPYLLALFAKTLGSTSLLQDLLEDLQLLLLLFGSYCRFTVVNWCVVFEISDYIAFKLGDTALELVRILWIWLIFRAILFIVNELASLSVRTESLIVEILAQLCLIGVWEVGLLSQLFFSVSIVAGSLKCAEAFGIPVLADLCFVFFIMRFEEHFLDVLRLIVNCV